MRWMANVGNAMGGGGGFPTDSPAFKISMREYEDMPIKVSDKVTIEIKKADSSGVAVLFVINRLKIA
jgi:hypothetical protein